MLINPRSKNPINPPARDDCLLATHPSDHNSIQVTTTVLHWARTIRAEKRQKRRARDLDKVKRGKMEEAEYQRGTIHETPFLVPIPYYYYPIGVGCAGGCGAGFGELFLFNIQGRTDLSSLGGCGSANAGCGGAGGCGGEFVTLTSG
jgi:hypothetical protein